MAFSGTEYDIGFAIAVLIYALWFGYFLIAPVVADRRTGRASAQRWTPATRRRRRWAATVATLSFVGGGAAFSVALATVMSHPPQGWHFSPGTGWYRGHTWAWYFDPYNTSAPPVYRAGPGLYVTDGSEVGYGDAPDWRPSAATHAEYWFFATLATATLWWLIRYWDRIRAAWRLTPRWGRALWVLWIPALGFALTGLVDLLVWAMNRYRPGALTIPRSYPQASVPWFAAWTLAAPILVLAVLLIGGTLFVPWAYYLSRAVVVYMLSVGRGSWWVLSGEVERFDALAARWQSTKKTPDVEASLGQLAVVLRAATLLNRLEQTGDEAAVDESVDQLRDAVRLLEVPDGLLFGLLGLVIMPTLGYVLQVRAERLHSVSAVNESVQITEQLSGKRFQARILRRLAWSLLSQAYSARHARLGDPADLDRAIELAWKAGGGRCVPLAGARRAHLAELLIQRAALDGNQRVLDIAVRMAEHRRWRTRSLRGRALDALSEALQTRFAVTADQRDLRAAEAAAAQAVSLTSAHAPARARRVARHAMSCHALAVSAGDTQAEMRATQLWQAACKASSSPVLDRLRAARDWAEAAAQAGRWPGAWIAYRTAVALLPSLVWRGVARHDQEWLLAKWGGLVADAVAAALEAGDVPGAIEAFERGRAILWSQVAELRRDLPGGSDGALVARLTQLAAILDAPAPEGQRLAAALHRRVPLAAGLDEESRTALAREYDALRIAIDPAPAVSYEWLRTAADKGPVVLVNVAARRCDALIIRANARPRAIRLSRLSADDVLERIRTLTCATRPFSLRLQQAGAQISDAGHLPTAAAANEAAVDEAGLGEVTLNRATAAALSWLWDAVAEPVLEALGYRDPVDPRADAPRIWLCPGGPLALLPLHAAGRHAARDGRSVVDRVAVSYTPTLRTLITARIRPAIATAPDPLVIALPQTPGYPSLPGAAREQALVAARSPAPCRVIEGSSATVGAVRDALSRHAWVHFACHGRQDTDKPTMSGIVLHDGVLTARELAWARATSGEFAYLSACEGATADPAITDESTHPAALLHLGGFRHVVAALGPVVDQEAGNIAAGLYEHFGVDWLKAPSAAPQLLRRAVLACRDARPGAPSAWCGFLHIGP